MSKPTLGLALGDGFQGILISRIDAAPSQNFAGYIKGVAARSHDPALGTRAEGLIKSDATASMGPAGETQSCAAQATKWR